MKVGAAPPGRSACIRLPIVVESKNIMMKLPIPFARSNGRVRHWTQALLLAPALLAFTAANGQDHAQTQGGYTLRSSLVASTALPEAMLKANGFGPASDKALLNVVVLKGHGEQREPVAARVDAKMRDLMGMSHHIDMREVRDNDRISYFGMVDHAPGEAMTFEIEATPQGSDKPLKLTYQDRLVH